MTKTRRSVSTAAEAKRCVIYTRKSTTRGLEQEFNSLDAQREACEAYIKTRPGWIVVDEFCDGGFSAASMDRPDFQKLLADVDAGKIDVVVVYKVDRLSRSLMDFARVMDRFNAAGTAFVSVTQNFSTADAMGRLTLHMLMSFAEFEREMIAERTRDKISAARRKGKWTGGPVPLGYTLVDHKLVVDELEASFVREAFALYLRHGSAAAVARELNDRHCATKHHRSKNGRVRRGRAWTKESVTRVLRNSLYAGFTPLGHERHEGEHPAIIGRDLFEQVAAILDGHGEDAKDRGRNPQYLLRGLLRCVGAGADGRPCGRPMVATSTRKDGREYRYYRCASRDKSARVQTPCRSAALPAASLEDFVRERIRRAVTHPDAVDAVHKSLRGAFERRRALVRRECVGLPSRIAALPEGEERDRASARLALAQQRLAAFEAIAFDGDWVRKALANFDWIWDAFRVEERRRLVRAVVRRIDVNEPEDSVSVILLSAREKREPSSGSVGVFAPILQEDAHAAQ